MQRELYLYAQESSKNPMIFAVQGDTARNLVCHFPDIDVATEVTSARIYIEKPDGHKVYNNCTKNNDGTITAPLTSQSLAAIGKAKAQIQLTGASGYITTYEFIINVLKTIIDSSAIESTDEWGALEYLLDKAGAYVVQSLSDMTDTTKTYYVADTGFCYVYDGTEWVVIGVSEEAIEEAIQEIIPGMLTDYAKIDGYYESLSVGTADNLIDRKGNGTLQQFVRRTSCGDESITDDGTGVIQSIRGKTLVFNQLYENKGTFTNRGVTFTPDSNGFITATGENDGTSASFYTVNIDGVVGHKYLVTGGDSRSVLRTVRLYITSGGNTFGCVDGATRGIITANSDTIGVSICVYTGVDADDYPYSFRPQVFDLTKMFGAGNEPTADEFVELFPDYYATKVEGTLINFMGMKSAGSVYDELTLDKAVTRIGKVDLGSLTWSRDTSGAFYTILSTKKMASLNLVCGKYPTLASSFSFANYDTYPDKIIAGNSGATSNIVFVKDTSYSDKDTFKTAMDGVMLYYELETPTETLISPPLNLSYKVADFGTETVDDGNLITDGFNQWDEVWELGSINNTTGQNVSSTTGIRGTNYIAVFPNTEYYLKTPVNLNPFFYDGDKTYIGRYGSNVRDSIFTIPDNARYMRIAMPSGYGTTYNNDICINLSWSGYRNGEYEPYWKRSLDLCVDDYFTDDNPQNMPYAPFNAVIKYSMDYAREVPRLRTQVDDLIARVTALEGGSE